MKGPTLTSIRKSLYMGCLAILGVSSASGFEKIGFQGGTLMGYNYGQNGVGWPSFGRDPLGNPGRGGFYISQLRLQARIDFDSTFAGVATGNLLYADPQELYLEKRWGEYRVKAGKFRGAGLKSATGADEFQRTTVNPPRYARVWNHYKRLLNFRDFGIQVERDFLRGDLRNRFFVHNANGENVFNDEPSYPAGQNTQVLGLDYGLDWRISPYTVWGGHIGAVADREWDDFIGEHEGWKAGYWFKSNAVVDASLNHQLDMGRLHIFNEALIMLLRDLPNPSDSGATKNWGVSSLVRFEHSERWGSYFRYEFFDHTDGIYADDALHMFTLGAAWRPSPAAYPGLRVSTQYVRSYEEGFENTIPNDLFHCEMRMVF